MFQERLKDVSREFQVAFKGIWKKFKRNFKKVLKVFQGNVKGVSKKFKRCFRKLSRVFQESLRVYCNYVVAWHSSQLPEQKEGLFYQIPTFITSSSINLTSYQISSLVKVHLN